MQIPNTGLVFTYDLNFQKLQNWMATSNGAIASCFAPNAKILLLVALPYIQIPNKGLVFTYDLNFQKHQNWMAASGDGAVAALHPALKFYSSKLPYTIFINTLP